MTLYKFVTDYFMVDVEHSVGCMSHCVWTKTLGEMTFDLLICHVGYLELRSDQLSTLEVKFTVAV